jgi:hypothetical protein
MFPRYLFSNFLHSLGVLGLQLIDISSITFPDIFEGLPGGGFHDSAACGMRLDALYPTVYLNLG